MTKKKRAVTRKPPINRIAAGGQGNPLIGPAVMKQIRKDMGLTVGEMSRAINTHPSVVKRYEFMANAVAGLPLLYAELILTARACGHSWPDIREVFIECRTTSERVRCLVIMTASMEEVEALPLHAGGGR